MTKGTETLASLPYARDSNSQVLPQHVWEVGAIAFAATCVIGGFFFLRAGVAPPGTE